MNYFSKICNNLAQASDCLPVFWQRLCHPKYFSFGLARSIYQLSRSEGGMNIKTVIDVGANVGQFAAMARFAWKDAIIYSFEPHSVSAKTFKEKHSGDRRIKLFEQALGHGEKEVSFFIHEASVQNSILPTLEEVESSESLVALKSLDSVCLDLSKKDVLLKLDVQGYEMQVLQGATNTLKNVEWLMLEVSLKPNYAGMPEISEIWDFLQGFGFKYYNIMDFFKGDDCGKIRELDLLFRKGK